MRGGTVSSNKRNNGLDRYDVAILSALASNTRLTTVELATKVHLSRTAVSRRIAALKRTHVLNTDADVLNYESLGFSVRALVEVNVPSRTGEALRKELLVQPEVLSVSIIAGDGRLCLDVIAIDTDHLHSFVRTLQKSGDTSTKIIFAGDKSQLTLIERMQLLSDQAGQSLVRM